MEWGREEELARFADLCDYCREGDVDLALDFSECGDTEPDPDDTEFGIKDVVYTLRVHIWSEDIIYAYQGLADFLTVRVEEEGRWRLLELRGFERPEPPF